MVFSLLPYFYTGIPLSYFNFNHIIPRTVITRARSPDSIEDPRWLHHRDNLVVLLRDCHGICGFLAMTVVMVVRR